MKTISLLVFLSSTIAGCGLQEKANQNAQSQTAAPEQKQATLVQTAGDAEACTNSNEGELIYAKDTGEFQVCELGTWTAIDLKGKDGVNGQDGADGKPGAPGNDGAGLMEVYSHKQLIGYYLGGKEIELISGSIGYFDFATGASLGVPVNSDTEVNLTVNNVCYYEANDCTGACWMDVSTGAMPQPGFVFTEGQTVWRIEGDERLVQSLSYLSFRSGSGDKCHVPQTRGTISAVAMEHKEKLPAGLTIPFGELTIGRSNEK